VSSAASELLMQGINSLIVFGAWTIWTHRNRCVFDGAALDIARRLLLERSENYGH